MQPLEFNNYGARNLEASYAINHSECDFCTAAYKAMAEHDLASILRRAASALGYSALKAEQEQAITHFVNGNDVLVSLPTGYGKSL